MVSGMLFYLDPGERLVINLKFVPTPTAAFPQTPVASFMIGKSAGDLSSYACFIWVSLEVGDCQDICIWFVCFFNSVLF